MSVSLEIAPDLAARIAARAELRGISTDAYLRLLIEERESNDETRGISAREKARLWRDWAESHNPDTPILTDEAISRESIYRERG